MKKKKLVTTVIRGAVMRVTPQRAAELRKMEREAMREDWRKNRVD